MKSKSYLELGKYFESQNDYNSAAKYFDLHIESHPNDQKALLYIGNYYRQINDLPNAKRLYQSLLKSNPNSMEATNNLHLILMMMLEWDDLLLLRSKKGGVNKTPFISIATSDNPKENLAASKNFIKYGK